MAKINWIDEDSVEELRGPNDEKDRVLEVPVNADGDSLYVVRAQPWGIFKVKTSRGAVPAQLSGMYTGIDIAERAIRKYVAETVSNTKMRPKGVPAKTKSEAAIKAKQTMVTNKQAEQGQDG